MTNAYGFTTKQGHSFYLLEESLNGDGSLKFNSI